MSSARFTNSCSMYLNFYFYSRGSPAMWYWQYFWPTPWLPAFLFFLVVCSENCAKRCQASQLFPIYHKVKKGRCSSEQRKSPAQPSGYAADDWVSWENFPSYSDIIGYLPVVPSYILVAHPIPANILRT